MKRIAWGKAATAFWLAGSILLAACGRTPAPVSSETAPADCPFIRYPEWASERLVHGPFPSAEAVEGTWLGGLWTEDGWEYLEIDLDCSAPPLDGTPIENYGWRARSDFRIEGSDVFFDTIDPAGRALAFRGMLNRGRLRGGAEVGGVRRPFVLAQEYPLSREEFAAFEGGYEIALNRMTYLFPAEGEGRFAFQNEERVVFLRAVSPREFLSPAGDTLAVIRDQDGREAQIHVGLWNEDGEPAVRRAIGSTREIRVPFEEGEFAAAIWLPQVFDPAPPVLVMVEGLGGEPDLIRNMHAHRLVRRGFAVLRYDPVEEPAGKRIDRVRAVVEHARTIRGLNSENVALAARGDGCELLSQLADVDGLIFLMAIQPDWSETLREELEETDVPVLALLDGRFAGQVENVEDPEAAVRVWAFPGAGQWMLAEGTPGAAEWRFPEGYFRRMDLFIAPEVEKLRPEEESQQETAE